MTKKHKMMLSAVMAVCLAITGAPIKSGATPADDINSLTQKKNELANEEDSINAQLVELMIANDNLAIELDRTEAELAEIQAEFAVAKADEEEQYKAMKLRIKYMYENGNDTLVASLLESKSIADLVNRMEYANKVNEYDRGLLEKYSNTKKQIEDLEARALSEREELYALQNEYATQEADLEATLTDLRAKADDFDAQIADAQAKAAEQQRQASQAYSGGGGGDTGGGYAYEPGSQGDYSYISGGGGDYDQGDTTTITGASYNAELGQAIVDYACQFIGNEYVWGGNSLTEGCDCSGFTQQVFAHFGISLPRVTGDQRYAGVEVGYGEAMPGDLVLYSGHVAIYTGNGGIVHASDSAPYPIGGIKTGYATYRTILSIRRLAL